MAFSMFHFGAGMADTANESIKKKQDDFQDQLKENIKFTRQAGNISRQTRRQKREQYEALSKTAQGMGLSEEQTVVLLQGGVDDAKSFLDATKLELATGSIGKADLANLITVGDGVKIENMGQSINNLVGEADTSRLGDKPFNDLAGSDDFFLKGIANKSGNSYANQKEDMAFEKGYTKPKTNYEGTVDYSIIGEGASIKRETDLTNLNLKEEQLAQALRIGPLEMFKKEADLFRLMVPLANDPDNQGPLSTNMASQHLDILESGKIGATKMAKAQAWNMYSYAKSNINTAKNAAMVSALAPSGVTQGQSNDAIKRISTLTHSSYGITGGWVDGAWVSSAPDAQAEAIDKSVATENSAMDHYVTLMDGGLAHEKSLAVVISNLTAQTKGGWAARDDMATIQTVIDKVGPSVAGLHLFNTNADTGKKDRISYGGLTDPSTTVAGTNPITSFSLGNYKSRSSRGMLGQSYQRAMGAINALDNRLSKWYSKNKSTEFSTSMIHTAKRKPQQSLGSRR